jgi:hypothetical protein
MKGYLAAARQAIIKHQKAVSSAQPNFQTANNVSYPMEGVLPPVQNAMILIHWSMMRVLHAPSDVLNAKQRPISIKLRPHVRNVSLI